MEHIRSELEVASYGSSPLTHIYSGPACFRYPALPSRLLPLPYHPNLKRELRSVTAAPVLTYLQIYHPSSQDTSGAPLRASVTKGIRQ